MPFDHFAAIAPIYARVSYSKRDLLREFAVLPIRGRLLDVGGGTGRVSGAIRDLLDEAILVDVSLGMLREISQTDLRPVCSSSESLPFADNSFERVIIFQFAFQVFADLTRRHKLSFTSRKR
ncbi:MAG: class I SAM-dependent methyltransferase [Anaerolineaceae bacterium]|nr:class I SAM-dependent methyltransferase [Anaerolineaceae bacterium]